MVFTALHFCNCDEVKKVSGIRVPKFRLKKKVETFYYGVARFSLSDYQPQTILETYYLIYNYLCKNV